MVISSNFLLNTAHGGSNWLSQGKPGGSIYYAIGYRYAKRFLPVPSFTIIFVHT